MLEKVCRFGGIPSAWTGVQRGQRIQRSFPIAEPVEVQVVELGEDGRKIRLAAKGIDPKKQAASGPEDAADRRDRPPRRKKERQAESGPMTIASSNDEGSFGTSLADKLRAALDQPSGN